MLRLDSVSPERVDQLLGIAPSWRIRATTMAAGGVVVAAAGLAAAVIGVQTGCWSDPFVVRSRDTTMSLMGAAPLVAVAVLSLTAPAIRGRLLRRLVG
jgi:hypothetical protein